MDIDCVPLGNFMPQWNRQLARDCARALRKPVKPAINAHDTNWRVFAGLAVDFAVDCAQGAPLWAGYENWNRRHFGHPLPITEGDPGTGLSDTRLRHFVWRALTAIDDDILPSPDHPDVLTLTDVTAAFFAKKQPLPVISRLLDFQHAPHPQIFDVKRKMVSLGMSSYFFRDCYHSYIEKLVKKENLIGVTDDFLFQAHTSWSGMRVVDLAAEALDLPAARREDLLAGGQRHFAPYRVDAIEKGGMRVKNLVTDAIYDIDLDMPPPFRRGDVVFGGLVPWDGRWQWSGAQRMIGSGASGEKAGLEIKETMKTTASKILCRYWPKYREQVMRLSNELLSEHLAYNGGRDLMIYPNPQAMEDDVNKFHGERYDRLVAAKKAKGGEGAEIPPRPTMAFPGDLRSSNEEIALFINRSEGLELLKCYGWLRRALEKKGVGLSDDEREAACGFIQSTAVSPAFVHRVLQDFPADAFKVVFGLPTDAPPYWLDWLLRCWKGEYYQPRYPCLSVTF